MTQVEALRVEVSALEAEIRRTEHSTLAGAHKDARIRGLASRAAESYGRMLSLLREAADTYPAILTEPLDIPHSFSRRERERLIELPECPPGPGRRDIGVFIAIGVTFVLVAMLHSSHAAAWRQRHAAMKRGRCGSAGGRAPSIAPSPLDPPRPAW